MEQLSLNESSVTSVNEESATSLNELSVVCASSVTPTNTVSESISNLSVFSFVFIGERCP